MPDNGEDLEDGQERDGATTSLATRGRPGHVQPVTVSDGGSLGRGSSVGSETYPDDDDDEDDDSMVATT